jgi:hypothetical protein
VVHFKISHFVQDDSYRVLISFRAKARDLFWVRFKKPQAEPLPAVLIVTGRIGSGVESELPVRNEADCGRKVAKSHQNGRKNA